MTIINGPSGLVITFDAVETALLIKHVDVVSYFDAMMQQFKAKDIVAISADMIKSYKQLPPGQQKKVDDILNAGK